MGLFTNHKKNNFDLSYILSKAKKSTFEQLWIIIPMEICEIIFNHWKKLHIAYAKQLISSLSDSDIYAELRHRNQNCFTPTDHGYVDFYVRCMSEIGLLDITGFENNLVYSKNEIEAGSEIVNMNIKNNIYYPELIVRTDYYTLSDLYDSINTTVTLHNYNPDADEYDEKMFDLWTSQTIKKRLQYCIGIFPKVKDQFLLIEQMTTNCSRFNSLKQASYDIMRNLLIQDVADEQHNATHQNSII